MLQSPVCSKQCPSILTARSCRTYCPASSGSCSGRQALRLMRLLRLPGARTACSESLWYDGLALCLIAPLFMHRFDVPMLSRTDPAVQMEFSSAF